MVMCLAQRSLPLALAMLALCMMTYIKVRELHLSHFECHRFPGFQVGFLYSLLPLEEERAEQINSCVSKELRLGSHI